MLDELLRTTGSLEFEESGGIRLLSASQTERGCELGFLVWPGQGDSPERWRVACSDMRRAQITFDRFDSLRWTPDHVLTAPYREGHIHLAFHGRARSTAALIGDLWTRHQALAGTHIPFGTYLSGIRGPSPLAELLGTGMGVLADGPPDLLHAYAEVLRAHRVEPSLYAPYRLGLYEADDFGVLIFGSSYVIGSGMDARRTIAPEP